MNNKTEDQFSLEKFSPLIAELESKSSMYMSLSINWINDKENQAVVQKAKMEVVRLRTSIEKFAKEIRDPHTSFNRLVSEKEKELIAKINPVEKHLKAEQEKIEQELKRIEQEEKEKAKKIFEERINKLSSIWHTPGNFFAIWNMKDDEFEKYYNEIKEENEIKEKIQIGLNMISSCLSLEELEELHHNDIFLETYQTQQFKEAFEKRFNEITEEQKRKQEYFKLQLVNKINSANNWKELNDLLSIHNDFILNNDEIKNIFDNKKEFLIRQDHNNQLLKYTNEINIINNINELDSFYTNLWFYREEIEALYKQRKQFLEQQEELNKIKAEQEEKRKQEEEEQKKKQQEEEQKRKIKETRIADLKSKIWNTQTEEELKELYFKEDIQDLIPEVKHIFTERKNEILEKVKKDQQQKEFQQYLYSIWYSTNDCIIQNNSQWETLIYKLIGKWKT